MARSARKLIAAAYAPMTVPVEGTPEAVDVLNASGGERLVLDAPTPLGPYRYRVLDALGAVREEGDVTLDGPRGFAVPLGGMLALERRR
jgi:hypothetical protein